MNYQAELKTYLIIYRRFNKKERRTVFAYSSQEACDQLHQLFPGCDIVRTERQHDISIKEAMRPEVDNRCQKSGGKWKDKRTKVFK